MRPALIASFSLCALWSAPDARGHILRERARYAVLLCQYTDSGQPPLSPPDVVAAFTNPGAVSMRDYWLNVSRGQLGSVPGRGGNRLVAAA